jgi:DNA (cytosine-5)-methyltransferase 1
MASIRIHTETRTSAVEVAELRRLSGLSQTLFAKAVERTPRTIKRWESGECVPEPLALRELRRLFGREVGSIKPAPEFRFIDLFAGIGGLRLGFESIGGKCVFTSEWDESAQRTYRANFGEHAIAGDIVSVQASTIPEHDVLLAGFPCQPFSIAGVSKKNALGRPHGFECETQGTLFFEVERILTEHRPRAFLLENVKNLQSHDGGRTFAVIMRTLREKLGYNVWTRVLNGRAFVPQHRERILIVGFRDDVDFNWDDLQLPASSEWPNLSTILHSEDGSEEPEERFLDAKGRVLKKYVLTDNLWRYLQDYAAKHRAKGNGFGFGLVGPADIARTLSARYYKDGSEILVRRKRGNPRRLTPRECARLMGFDRGDRRWSIPVSDTQSYRQFGNSVVVPLIEAVAKAMRPHIVGEARPDRREQLTLELAAAG